MTPDERAALRELAGKATPGLHHVGHGENHAVFDARGYSICKFHNENGDNDASFFAACSPEVITSMLDQIDAMERVVEAARCINNLSSTDKMPNCVNGYTYHEWGQLRDALASLPTPAEGGR